MAAFFFYLLLMVAAADDIIARYLRVPVFGVLSLIRVLLLTVPWLAGLIAWLLARALRAGAAAGLGALTLADLRAALRRRPAVSARGEPERKAAEPEPVPARRTEIWPDVADTWRWRYVDETTSGEPVVLAGNVAVETDDEAAAAARTAYPDVPVTRGVDVELERVIREHPETLQPRLGHRILGLLWYPLMFFLRRRLRSHRRRRGVRPGGRERP